MEADPNYGKMPSSNSSDNLNKLTENGIPPVTDVKSDAIDQPPKKKAKGKGGKEDPYAPTPTQVQNMLEEMLLLEQVGVDEVREVEEIILDDGNGDDDEIPMELLDRAEKIKRRNRDLEKKKNGNFCNRIDISINL